MNLKLLLAPFIGLYGLVAGVALGLIALVVTPILAIVSGNLPGLIFGTLYLMYAFVRHSLIGSAIATVSNFLSHGDEDTSLTFRKFNISTVTGLTGTFLTPLFLFGMVVKNALSFGDTNATNRQVAGQNVDNVYRVASSKTEAEYEESLKKDRVVEKTANKTDTQGSSVRSYLEMLSWEQKKTTQHAHSLPVSNESRPPPHHHSGVYSTSQDSSVNINVSVKASVKNR